jgi:Zn-dependent membrane protease YugP
MSHAPPPKLVKELISILGVKDRSSQMAWVVVNVGILTKYSNIIKIGLVAY